MIDMWQINDCGVEILLKVKVIAIYIYFTDPYCCSILSICVVISVSRKCPIL